MTYTKGINRFQPNLGMTLNEFWGVDGLYCSLDLATKEKLNEAWRADPSISFEEFTVNYLKDNPKSVAEPTFRAKVVRTMLASNGHILFGFLAGCMFNNALTNPSMVLRVLNGLCCFIMLAYAFSAKLEPSR